MPGSFYHQTPNTTIPTEYETVPQFIPVAAATLMTEDFHVTEITLANVTASPVTVTITDRQAVPMALFQAVTIAANATYEAPFKGRWMPNGIVWSASADSSIVGTIRGYIG